MYLKGSLLLQPQKKKKAVQILATPTIPDLSISLKFIFKEIMLLR